MHLILVILCSFTMLFSDSIQQKLIVSADKDTAKTQENLLKLEVYFIENPEIRALQEKNQLQLEMEKLGDFMVVAIKPVDSLALKNELVLWLNPLFPDIFAMNENKKRVLKKSDPNMEVAVKKKEVKPITVAKPVNQDSGSEEIKLQWIILVLLAIIGLALTVLNRKKLATLHKTQKNLSENQDKIEDEIENLGATNV